MTTSAAVGSRPSTGGAPTSPEVPPVARDRAELAALLAALRRRRARVALVPTMGALHDGHRALLRRAAELADAVVVSIFVNPLQFGPAEDLDRYPRTLAADLAVCRADGVAGVWAPAVDQMYAGGIEVTVTPGSLGEELDGASRPGHFGGVLTVVAKLFGLVRPDVAVFGEKDYQQLTLIRRMVGDLELGVALVGVPTVREPDGLALSSRNRHLAGEERSAALALSGALRAGAAAGPAGPAAVLAAGRAVLAAQPAVAVDYLALRDPGLGPPPPRGPARLLVAARVGTTRLIDNMPVLLGPSAAAGTTGTGDRAASVHRPGFADRPGFAGPPDSGHRPAVAGPAGAADQAATPEPR